MKRKLSLIIAFTFSFLILFSSIAMAEDVKIPIPEHTSKSGDLGNTVKVPPLNVDNINFFKTGEEVKAQVSQKNPIDKILPPPKPIPLRCLSECEPGGGGGSVYMKPIYVLEDGKLVVMGHLCIPCSN